MEYKPGDKVMIKIGDRDMETVIDEHGVQRLPDNPVYSALFDSGALDLNALAVAYHKGKISFENYLEYYLHIGYSVDGFADLSAFQELEITNPIWDAS